MVTAGAVGCRCRGFTNSTGEGWAGAGLRWDRGMHEHLGALLVSPSSSLSHWRWKTMRKRRGTKEEGGE